MSSKGYHKSMNCFNFDNGAKVEGTRPESIESSFSIILVKNECNHKIDLLVLVIYF